MKRVIVIAGVLVACVVCLIVIVAGVAILYARISNVSYHSVPGGYSINYPNTFKQFAQKDPADDLEIEDGTGRNLIIVVGPTTTSAKDYYDFINKNSLEDGSKRTFISKESFTMNGEEGIKVITENVGSTSNATFTQIVYVLVSGGKAYNFISTFPKGDNVGQITLENVVTSFRIDR